jgi:very-short-patch-repair endonuclease
VIDFFCTECDLGIELDGAPHYRLLREDYEAERTKYLETAGVELLRFENKVVRKNLEAVLETIRDAVRRKGCSTSPRRADNLR